MCLRCVRTTLNVINYKTVKENIKTSAYALSQGVLACFSYLYHQCIRLPFKALRELFVCLTGPLSLLVMQSIIFFFSFGRKTVSVCSGSSYTRTLPSDPTVFRLNNNLLDTRTLPRDPGVFSLSNNLWGHYVFL